MDPGDRRVPGDRDQYEQGECEQKVQQSNPRRPSGNLAEEVFEDHRRSDDQHRQSQAYRPLGECRQRAGSGRQ